MKNFYDNTINKYVWFNTDVANLIDIPKSGGYQKPSNNINKNHWINLLQVFYDMWGDNYFKFARDLIVSPDTANIDKYKDLPRPDIDRIQKELSKYNIDRKNIYADGIKRSIDLDTLNHAGYIYIRCLNFPTNIFGDVYSITDIKTHFESNIVKFSTSLNMCEIIINGE